MKIDKIKELTAKLTKDNYKMNKLTYGIEFVKEFRHNIFRIVYIKNYNEIKIVIENKSTDMVIISSKYYNLLKISDLNFIFLIDRIKIFARLFNDLFID